MPLKKIGKFGKWIGKQTDGFVGGVMRLASTPWSSWLPAGLSSTVRGVGQAIGWSVGTATPIRQITSAVTLALLSIAASWITLGATLVLVVFFVLMIGVGVARLVPAIDRGFVSVRDTLIPRGRV